MRLLALLFFLVVSAPLGAEELKTWTDKQGREMQAKVVRLEGDTVTFRRSDGKNFRFSIRDLSLESQSELLKVKTLQEVEHIPPLFRQRIGRKNRLEAIVKAGGDEQVLVEIEKALDWLVAHQDEDGRFGEKAQVAATATALLAFLGNGETADSPRYGKTILAAVHYLIERAETSMPIHQYSSPYAGYAVYEHAFATQALAEYHLLTEGTKWEERQMESILRKSVGVIVDGFSRHGGWAHRYSREDYGSLFLSIWQIHSLWTARQTGIDFPGLEKTFEKAREYWNELIDPTGKFKTYSTNTIGASSFSGGAVFCLRLMNAEEDRIYHDGMRTLQDVFKELDNDNHHALSTHYFNCLAIYHDKTFDWESFQPGVVTSLLERQDDLGHWAGNLFSNDSDDRAIGTAWAALILGTPFRYAKIGK